MALTDGSGPNRDSGQARGAVTLTDQQRNLDKVSGDRTNVVDFLKIAKEAESVNTQFMGELRSRWSRSYRAYRSEHFAGSKYRMKQWAARSKLFRPKTRSAVRMAMSAAAGALFSTEDVVSVEAQLQTDPTMLASAAVNQELLNYRLDRTTRKGGIPWFIVAMGSVFNATVTGITISKQYWDYRTKPKSITRMVPATDASGQPVLHPQTGEQIMRSETIDGLSIVTDRPMIDLIPSENVMLDLAAPWYDPAQLSAYFVARYPMLVGDLKSMIAAGSKPGANKDAGVQWLEVDDAALQTMQEDYDAQGVRLAREGGQDSKGANGIRTGMGGDYGIVWVHENFFRYDGEDYHFWSIGTDIYISQPILTENAYPHLHGDRPYVYGYGAIEPHMVYPQSAVESWQPLQQEANDIVNLRLDSLKQALEPIAKVRTGSLLDKTALQPGKRGAPGAIVDVQKMDDLEFATWPNPGPQAYGDESRLNADFDDLSGVFSGSSVQTNRSLNETVGGMRLMNASAGSIKEFDLRVWVETWCEPTLRHVMHLEQYYESDETVLAIAGQRAQVWEKFGVSQLTDEHLTREVGLRVNVGVGSTDPMQKIQKMQMGLTMVGGLTPFFDRPVKVRADEIIPEIMGMIGQKGGQRFFEMGQPGQGAGGKDDQAAQAQADAQAKMALERMRNETQIQLAQMNNASAADRDRMKAQLELITTMIKMQHDATQSAQDRQTQGQGAAFQHMSKMLLGHQTNRARMAQSASAGPETGGNPDSRQMVPTQPSLPQPSGSPTGPMMQAEEATLEQVTRGFSAIGNALAKLTNVVGQLVDQSNAPVELVRDAQGQPQAVRS